ncbi:MAG TPA: RES family NAD+ phosphorylase [Candidatus Acidoferrum sp.]
MTLVVWRIVQRRLTKHALTGEGARRFGGRWNSPGLAIIYTAQSQSLAALEILVHIDSDKILNTYTAIPIQVDQKFVLRIDDSELPNNWRAYPATRTTRKLGDNWLIKAESAVFQVPSAVIPNESNFLLNPAHPDFRKLIPSKPIPFKFDSRLTIP